MTVDAALPRSLERDGLRLALDVAGEGPPFLVFQHGLMGDAAQAAEAMPPDIPHARLTLECRGHGGSDPGPDEALSIATFTDDLAHAIEAVAVPPLPVAGISMGAAMALRLAVRRPDLVSALILVRPAWTTEAAPPNMAPYAEVGELIASRGPVDGRLDFAGRPTARRMAEAAPGNLDSLLGFFDRPRTALTATMLTRIAADGPGVTEDEVGRIGCPALVVGQARDLAHPLAMAETLADLIPHARMVQVPPKCDTAGGHLDALHAAIAEFLGEIA